MERLDYPETPGYFDISPEIHEGTAVFPGDASFQRKVSKHFVAGDHLELSSIQTTVHIGAHADAPIHYHAGGAGIGSRKLDYYLGRCQVISVRLPRGAQIKSKDLGNSKIQARRVLFKTGSFPDPDQWNGDFNSLSAELIDHLAAQGVILAGIDTPSVDLSEEIVLESHQAIFRHDMAVLEGVVLKDVPDGFYTLVALPLKIRGGDASPVRAVLLKGGA